MFRAAVRRRSCNSLDPQSKVFSYAHPLFWAPFTFVSNGGVSSAEKP